MRSSPTRLMIPLLLALLAGCGGGKSSSPTAASSDAVVVESETLVPVSAQICHVRGTVVNTTDTAIDVSMRWQAFDAADKGIGTTRLQLSAVPPGGRRDFETSGFASNSRGLIGCSAIARFERIATVVTVRR